jgi:peptide/nickel transport system permease protein
MNPSTPMPRSRLLGQLRQSWPARVGLAIVLVALFVAAAPGLAARYERDARTQHLGAPPSWQHWLGTDDMGKDVYSRVCYGAQLSLLCGALSVTLATALGVPLGAVAGYYGGWIDTVLMRAIDIALAFPSVLVALLVAAAFRPGWATVIIAVGLINVPTIARQVRATVISVRHLDFVLASRALGATPLRTLRREILPSLVGPVVTLAALGIGTAILEVAALSFLGIGGDPTEPEWGSMLSQARDYWSTNVWAAVAPGLAISLTVLGFNLLGDALQDALDPTRYER